MTTTAGGHKTHPRRRPAGFFATTAPGLEGLLADEVARLIGSRGEISTGGVTFAGGLKEMRRVNLWSRIANRVLLRVGEFHAASFHELERRAKQIEWARFVNHGQPVRFRVTCRKSRLYHSDAIAERLAVGVNKAAGSNRHVVSHHDPDDDSISEVNDVDDAQLFVVRVVDDIVSISADSSGELLHRRGYRRAVAKAPLRETIAAAMIVGSGWDMHSPVVDPMCGAGTIAIEAAMIARHIAPGANRRFAFESWPRHDAGNWQAEVVQAKSEALPRSPARIIASDRDEGAIEAARSNAGRADVAGDIELDCRVLSAAELPGERGWIVTNPPYGLRVGEAKALRNLYAQLGTIVRASGWRVALLSADSSLEDQMKVDLREVFQTSNGGIPVHLMTGGE